MKWFGRIFTIDDRAVFDRFERRKSNVVAGAGRQDRALCADAARSRRSHA